MAPRTISLFFLALLLILVSCGPKQPESPPQELLDEMAAADASYKKATEYSPTPQDAAAYLAAIEEARALKNAGDYLGAMGKARLARLEAERLCARMVYEELLTYNPPQTLTYHYRQLMGESDEALKKKKIPLALDSAQKAREQAELALKLQKQCIEDCRKKLAAQKEQIEEFFKPDMDLVLLYWDAYESLPKKNCAQTKAMIQKIDEWVAEIKRTTISEKRVFYVQATSDYLRMYGEPLMYAEITQDGYLKNAIAQMPPGTPVKFVRSTFYSRDKTFYLVEDSRTGVQGWMAEERVWPERAMRH